MKQLRSFLKNNPSLRNLLTYGIGQGFNLITPLLVIPYIIAVCGIEYYGKTAFGMALTFFLIVFVDYGSDINGVKLVATQRGRPDALQQIFAVTYVSKLVVLILVLVVMSLLFLMVPYFSQEKTLYFFGLPILVAQFLNPTWFLQGIEGFTQITVLNILSKVIYLACVFAFINVAGDYVYVNLCWGIGMLISNGLSFIWLVRKKKFDFNKVRFDQVQEHLRTNFSMFSSQIFVSAQLYAPLLLIGFLGTPTMTGMYRVVDQIVVIFKTYLLLFFNFAFPRVCYLMEIDPKDGMRFWQRFNGGNFGFIALSMTGVFLFAPEIVHYFHKDPQGVLAGYLQFAVFVPLGMAVSIPLKQLILGFNQQRFYINFTMVVVIGNVVSMLLLLPQYGIFGVLVTLVVVEVVTSAAFFFRIKKQLMLR